MYHISETAPKRYTPDNRPVVRQPMDANMLLEGSFLEGRECFVVLFLDTRHRAIDAPYVVSVGSLNKSLVHPREVFREAIIRGAAALVVAHNHPSGDTDPSGDDVDLTARLDKAGTLLGIVVLDHLIVSGDNFTSLRETGHFPS